MNQAAKPEPEAQSTPRLSLASLTAAASVMVALTLIAAKLWAWLASGSVAVLASLFDSGLDLFASLIAFFGVRVSAEPADRDHRFGHSKAEAISSLTQAVIILLSAALVVREAIARMIAPAPLVQEGVAIGVMGLAIIATAFLFALQTFAIRKTGSLAIEADRAHYVGDLASNLGVLVSIVAATQLGWLWADPVAGLAVAALLIWSAAHILGKTLPQLMDQELGADDRARIIETVRAHPKALGLHALRTRRAARNIFIQFHLELAPEMSLRAAHDIADEVEAALHKIYPYADIIIHQDPYGFAEDHDDFGRASAPS